MAQQVVASAPSRGRPRSQARRTAILQAAGELLLSAGLAGTTVEAIAARAGVSKATIYRWWPSRGAVALEGFLLVATPSPQIPDDQPIRAALRAHLAALLAVLADEATAALFRSLVAEAQSDPEIGAALRDNWLAPRRHAVERLVRAAIAHGDLRRDLDIDVFLDQLFAPIYYRLLFGHAPRPARLATDLIDAVLPAASAASPAAAR